MASRTIKDTHDVIRDMKIRGAGRIARLAVAALKSYALECKASDPSEYYQRLLAAGLSLKSARPTAVSLPNATNFVLSSAKRALSRGEDVAHIREAVIHASESFRRTSLNAIRTIGEIGAKRIVDGDTVLTHCNSESAIAVLSTASRAGTKFSVIVTETRPLLQGRVTASLLAKKGIDVSLIPDSAARLYMHGVDKVVVGADAIASNGAVVNKIGTSQLALAAHETRTRVYVTAETYKLSPTTMLGEMVEIEERSPLEVVPSSWARKNRRVRVRNPSFDVTPPEYIDLVVTEQGVYPPQGIVMLMTALYPDPEATSAV